MKPGDTTSPSYVKGFIREVDGLRGIAILLVVFHHLWPESGVLHPFGTYAHLGWMGVDLFFVVSGMLITGILLDTKHQEGYYKNYLARRVLRVFPLYYLFIIAAYIAFPMVQSGSFSETPFVQGAGNPLWHIFYASNFRSAAGIEPEYIFGPLWSLCIEEQFYLIIPFLVAAVSRRNLAYALGALVIFAPLFRWCTMLMWPDLERIQYLATPSRVDVLAMGCLLAVYFRSSWKKPSTKQAGLACLTLTGMMIAFFFVDGFDRMHWPMRVFGYSLVALFFTSIVVWTTVSRDTAQSAFLRLKPLCFLGKLCYGIYILHRITEVLLVKVLAKLDITIAPSALMVIKIAAAVFVALLSWTLFEKPILRLKKRFQSQKHPQHQNG